MSLKLLLWLLIYLPLILLINGAIVFVIVKKIREMMIGTEEVIEFVVLGDSSESYETFLSLTYDLESIRKQVKTKEISEDEKNTILKELDEKLKILQESLIHIQSGGIPNPDILTKRYIQELTLQTMLIRIVFEKVMGRFFQEAVDKKAEEANVLKIPAIKREK